VKPTNQVLSGFGTTVFEVMSRLAIEHGAINLGQGFPDGAGPDDVREKAAEALHDRPNQYPPMLGVPELRQAVAAHGKRFYGLEVDWQTETMVASGATEVLAACFLGLLNPGDEVVLIEPLYDCYLPIIRLAGAVPRIVTAAAPDWSVSEQALTAAFSDKTKAILLNNPMNPTGKVFTRAELDLIAELCLRHDSYAICDEAYEHIVYDDHEHVPLIAVPGMRDRSIKIGSAGKTFSLTGWKVGYMTASPAVVAPIAKAHQFLTFTTPPNLQRAVAYGLGKDDAYFIELAADLQERRDFMARELAAIGLAVLPCHGTYFLNADFRPLGFEGDDEAFCRHITVEAGVTAVPVSAFYAAHPVRHLARFCFSKQWTVLEEAVSRLRRHFA
jgi:N-succinyldiaminopimelate aminotransferase